MKAQIEKVRFEYDLKLVKVIEEDYGLKNYYDIFGDPDEMEEILRSFLADSLKLNPIVAPRLYKICEEVCHQLEFTDDINFYIIASPAVNASSLHGFGVGPHIISLTSSLVQLLTDDELRYVIGHEIGHIIFSHSQPLLIYKLLEHKDEDELDRLLLMQLFRWDRYAEISADRVGFLVCPDYEIIGKVFFKFASGLSEEYLNFDINEYLKQLDEIKRLSRDKLESMSTHPNHLVRILALKAFSESSLLFENFQDLLPLQEKPKKMLTAQTLKKRVKELLDLMEYHPKKELDQKSLEFIATVGSYIAYSDGEFAQEELDLIVNFLLNLTSEPKKYLTFKTFDEIREKTDELCEYFAKANSAERYELFDVLIMVALANGRLDQGTREALNEVAKKLQITDREVMLRIKELSEQYLYPKHNLKPVVLKKKK